MEQNAENKSVDQLMNSIKEDYKARSKSKWMLIALIVLLVLNILENAIGLTTFSEYLRKSGTSLIILIVLILSALKNRHYFSKMGESATAHELLALHDRSVKWDYILAVVFLPLIILTDFAHSIYFYVLVGFVVVVLLLITKDHNIEKLRKLMAEQEGKEK